MAVAPEATRADLAPAASETAEQLFQEHAGWIYGYCLRLLRSPEEAEDALQTTYLNACRSLNRGTRPQVGSAWLLRIAQNVCFARLRSAGRRGRLERPQDFTILEETVPAPERSVDELIGLTDALCSIPERQREAILLREWQGLSYNEVGARLGLSQSAVETLIFRARRSLAGALEAPGKRGRRRALHALDLGGLAAALKGFFAGSAGIKTVAAVTAAVATTATVVATDPAGVWRDRHVPVAADARGAEQARTAAPAPAAALGPATASAATVVAPSESVRGPLPAQAETRPGAPADAPGRATSEKAKTKGKAKANPKANAGGNGKARGLGAGGNGNGKALGLTKESSTGPGTGQGTPGGGKANRPVRETSGPPPATPGKSQGKAKGAGAS
ncbi:MAG TPA: RNA polymerase sigma factor [Gaiellaceae bacterium]|nr:RNA polymerase sigma factor [Gaiellaceae bacterium]